MTAATYTLPDQQTPAAVPAEQSPQAEIQAAPLWRVTGSAVPGTSHERLGTPCQDALGYRILGEETMPGGALLIALADGAGSARFSDQGALTAVEAALQSMQESLEREIPEDSEGWECLLVECFQTARLAVFQRADSDGEWSRDYASTLTCVILTGTLMAVGQIGDGAVVAVDDTGELFTATRLQRGEYANETHFLIEEDALDQAVIDVIDRPVNAVAVMSDGLIRLALKMPSQEPHAPFFRPLFGFINAVDDSEAAAGQLAAFLSSERVNERTDDDKSLVLAARVTPAVREPVNSGSEGEVSREAGPPLDQEGK